MKRIFKYPIGITDEQTLYLPVGAKVLSVVNQREELVLYALVDDSKQDMEPRKVRIFGTGHPFDICIVESPRMTNEFFDFIGTVVTTNGDLIWHVFCEHSYKEELNG